MNVKVGLDFERSFEKHFENRKDFQEYVLKFFDDFLDLFHRIFDKDVLEKIREKILENEKYAHLYKDASKLSIFRLPNFNSKFGIMNGPKNKNISFMNNFVFNIEQTENLEISYFVIRNEKKFEENEILDMEFFVRNVMFLINSYDIRTCEKNFFSDFHENGKHVDKVFYRIHFYNFPFRFSRSCFENPFSSEWKKFSFRYFEEVPIILIEKNIHIPVSLTEEQLRYLRISIPFYMALDLKKGLVRIGFYEDIENFLDSCKRKNIRVRCKKEGITISEHDENKVLTKCSKIEKEKFFKTFPRMLTENFFSIHHEENFDKLLYIMLFS
jgi:hypothetical protein